MPSGLLDIVHAGMNTLSGVMGGVPSLTGAPINSDRAALRPPREELIGSLSAVHLFGAVPRYASMAANGRLGGIEAAFSTLALLPVACGPALGKRLRGRLGERRFRRMLPC